MFIRDTPAHNDQVRPQQLLHLGIEALQVRNPLLVGEVVAFASRFRRKLLGVMTIDDEVAKFGVGHEVAVDDERRTNSRSERGHQHHATTPVRAPVEKLAKAGGISVVEDVNIVPGVVTDDPSQVRTHP